MRPSILAYTWWVVLVIVLLPIHLASAQDKPSTAQIQDALSVKLPAFLTLSNVKIRGQAPDTSPGQVVLFLTQDWRPAIGIGPSDPFMKTVFSVSITADEALFEKDRQVGNLIVLRRVVDKGDTLSLNGIAASQQHGNLLVTSIVGFDQDLPPGRPRSNFARTSVIAGTPEADAAIAQASNAAKENVQSIRDSLLGVWHGYYVCGQGRTGGELSLTEMTDQGTISGTFKFFNLPGMHNAQPGSYAVSGKYDFAAKSLRIDPAGWIDHPHDYTAIPMVFPMITDWTKIEGRVLGGCKEIILSK